MVGMVIDRPMSEHYLRVLAFQQTMKFLIVCLVHDGRSIVDQAHYEEFHRLLESEHPQVVFTHWPIDNHADHRAISMLVYEAWLRMKRTFALYYYEVSSGED